MPIYEFRCKKCNAHLEVFQKLSDKSPTKCRKCGGRLEKQISAPAIQFKGEGWYVTDYARKGSKGEKESSGSDTKSDKSDTSTVTEKTKTKDAPKKTGSETA